MFNKKISKFVISLVFVFSLAGCNNDLANGLGSLVTDKLCDIVSCD